MILQVVGVCCCHPSKKKDARETWIPFLIWFRAKETSLCSNHQEQLVMRSEASSASSFWVSAQLCRKNPCEEPWTAASWALSWNNHTSYSYTLVNNKHGNKQNTSNSVGNTHLQSGSIFLPAMLSYQNRLTTSFGWTDPASDNNWKKRTNPRETWPYAWNHLNLCLICWVTMSWCVCWVTPLPRNWNSRLKLLGGSSQWMQMVDNYVMVSTHLKNVSQIGSRLENINQIGSVPQVRKTWKTVETTI